MIETKRIFLVGENFRKGEGKGKGECGRRGSREGEGYKIKKGDGGMS